MRRLALALLALGCIKRPDFWVYYNTFYNCQREFYTAERLREQGKEGEAKEHYQKAIEKGSKILKYHPTSAYVDDALYIVGVAHLRLGDAVRAQRKFQELIKYFPTSPYAAKAHLYLAKAYLDANKPRKALAELTEAIARDPKLEPEALLYKAQALLKAGEPAEAVKAIEEFLEKYPKSPKKVEALLVGAEAAKEAGLYEKGVGFLERVLKEYMGLEERKRAQVLLGDILFEWGKHVEALKAYEGVDLEPQDTLWWPLELRKGRAKEGMGAVEEAKAIYRRVAEEAKKPELRAEAFYWLGRILERQDSTDAAKEAYEEAVKGRGEFSGKAARRLQALRSWEELADSSSVWALYRKAEIAWLYLDKPKLADSLWREVVRKARGDYKPKALYALAYTHLKAGDTTGAKEFYRELLEKHGKTIYAKYAKRYLGAALGPDSLPGEAGGGARPPGPGDPGG